MALYQLPSLRKHIALALGTGLLCTCLPAALALPVQSEKSNSAQDDKATFKKPYEATSTEHTNLDETRRLERAMRRALKNNDRKTAIAVCTNLLQKCNEDLARKRIDSADFLTHSQGLEELFRMAQAYLWRGITYGEEKQDKEALDDFDKALAISPNFPSCLTNRAILLVREQKYKQALPDLDHAIALNPLSWDAHMTKSHIHEALGDTKAYNQDHQELSRLAAKLRSKPFRNTTLDFSLLSLSYDNKLIAVHPKEAAYYAFRAAAYQSQGNSEAAAKDASQAIALKPSQNAYTIRAEANFQLHNLPQALKDVEQALKMGAPTPRLYDTVARLDWDLGNKQKALADRAKQLQLDPTDAVAQINAGSMNYASGHYEAAIKNYTAALRSHGPYDKPTLLGYRGFAYANLKRYSEALTDADSAISLDPNCCSGFLVRGMCYNSMGKLKEAKQSLDRAMALSPHEAEAMRLQGELAAKTGDFEQATDYMDAAHQLDYQLFLGKKVPEIKEAEYVKTIKEYSTILKADAGNKEALFNRAVLYLCVNEPKRAIDDLDKFITLSKWQGVTPGQASLLMSIAYRQRGDTAGAARALAACKEHVPEKDRGTEMKFLLGEITENDALRAATDKSSQTLIRSYVGLDWESKGQKDKALTQYGWIARNGDETMDGFSLALSGIMRLKHGIKHVSPDQLPN